MERPPSVALNPEGSLDKLVRWARTVVILITA